MVNFLRNTSEILKTRRENVMSVAGQYVRPRTGESVSLSLSPGYTCFRVNDELLRSSIVRSYDFIVSTDELSFSSEITPKAGDQIITDYGVFEVCSYNNEPVWRYTSPYHSSKRIHTQKIG